MAKLVIVESPAKAKTIGKYLGDDYEVTASMGHIRDLPASQLGIDVEHGYAPQYISIKGKEKLIKELKSKAKHADGVLLATDPDREGEAISWHLANILGLDPHEPNRVTFDEITKKGVKEGMAHPRAIDEDLFNAQQARRVLDRLVGYKLSPFLWRKVRRGLSAAKRRSRASSPTNTGTWMPPSAQATRVLPPGWPPMPTAKSCCPKAKPRPAPLKRVWKGPSTWWQS